MYKGGFLRVAHMRACTPPHTHTKERTGVVFLRNMKINSSKDRLSTDNKENKEFEFTDIKAKFCVLQKMLPIEQIAHRMRQNIYKPCI